MLHLLYALALLLLLSGACAILGEKSNLSPALLPLPVLSGAVVVLYLCGIAGVLRAGAVLVLLALAAVWVLGLVQLRPAGVFKAWQSALYAPGFALFLGGAAFIWVLFCVQKPMFTQWDEFTAWGLAPKMVVERGAFYVADPVNLKASFTYPATSLITFLFQPFGRWAERACLAAIATLALILLLTMGHDTAPIDEHYDLLQIIPYVLVLAGGVAGINVFVVLLTGIVSGAVIMLLTGQVEATALLASMGNGAAGMFETSMVAILVAAMCALIRVYGGFDALLSFIRKVFRGKKGGQLGMGLLVGAMDIATANNTVAIVMANPIAKEMSEDYGISPSRTACLLDTFSCIFQGIIPYGAQMLVAISAAAEMGFALSAFSIMRYLFYPYLLLVSSLIAIFLVKGKKD